MRQKDVKKFWKKQREKESEQLRPLAEKIVRAVLKCSEVIKQENEQENEQEKEFTKEESVYQEITTKLKNNFNFQAQQLLERIENENCNRK